MDLKAWCSFQHIDVEDGGSSTCRRCSHQEKCSTRCVNAFDQVNRFSSFHPLEKEIHTYTYKISLGNNHSPATMATSITSERTMNGSKPLEYTKFFPRWKNCYFHASWIIIGIWQFTRQDTFLKFYYVDVLILFLWAVFKNSYPPLSSQVENLKKFLRTAKSIFKVKSSVHVSLKCCLHCISTFATLLCT